MKKRVISPVSQATIPPMKKRVISFLGQAAISLLKQAVIPPMSKKALSPMVSTVIMLVFAIGLGGLVISWGKSNFNIDGQDCTKASLSLVSVGGKPLICSRGSFLHATLSNDGSSQIAGIKVSLIGAQEPYSARLSQAINPGDAAKASFLVPDSFGKIQKALFTPLISIDGRELACPKFGVAVESVEDC